MANFQKKKVFVFVGGGGGGRGGEEGEDGLGARQAAFRLEGPL